VHLFQEELATACHGGIYLCSFTVDAACTFYNGSYVLSQLMVPVHFITAVTVQYSTGNTHAGFYIIYDF